MFDSGRVKIAKRLPGLIPSLLLTLAGITTWPFELIRVNSGTLSDAMVGKTVLRTYKVAQNLTLKLGEGLSVKY